MSESMRRHHLWTESRLYAGQMCVSIGLRWQSERSNDRLQFAWPMPNRSRLQEFGNLLPIWSRCTKLRRCMQQIPMRTECALCVQRSSIDLHLSEGIHRQSKWFPRMSTGRGTSATGNMSDQWWLSSAPNLYRRYEWHQRLHQSMCVGGVRQQRSVPIGCQFESGLSMQGHIYLESVDIDLWKTIDSRLHQRRRLPSNCHMSTRRTRYPQMYIDLR